MKKIISVLTSLMVMMLLVGNVMGTLAAVTPNFFVSIADEKVTEGTETAEVPIYIGSDDISALVLDFDIPEELDLIGVKTKVSDVQYNIEEGVVLFNSSTSEVNKFDINKEFAKLVFKIPTNAKAGDKYPIGFKSDSQGNVDIDASNVSGGLINPTIKTGSISIIKGGLNLYIDSKSCDVGTEEVEVPFRVDTLGGIAALNVQINVDNGAEITNVKAVDGYSNEGFQYNSEENIFLWNPFQNKNFPFERDNIFANITVKLPENLKEGDTFKISVTYVDASDAERNLMLPENEPVFGVITVGSPVDIKVHDVVIDTQEEFDALKTVADYSYITTTVDSTKKVVEVPIEVLNNPGMFTCKNKLILDSNLEIIGYKATNNILDTLESSTLTYSKDKQTIIWTKESAGDSKALGNIAVALIAIPNKDFEEATYSVDLDNYTAEFSTAAFNHIAFNLENGSIKLLPNEITTTTTTEPASTEFSIDVAKVEVNYSTVDQVVKVPVSIKNNPGFASFKFNFETSGLEIKSIIEDGIITGIDASRNNTSLLWVVEDPNGNNDIKQDGVLFTLEVLVPAGTAPGVYPIELTLGKEAIVDSNYNVQIPTEINNGQVEVIDVVTSGVTGEVTTAETSGVTGEVTTAETSGVTGEVTTVELTTAATTAITTDTTTVTTEETSGVTGEVTTAETSGVTGEVTTVETSGVTGEVTTEETSGVTGEVTTVELTTAATTAITTDTTTDTTTVTTTEPTSKEFSIDIAKVTVNYSTVDQVVKVPVSIKNNPGFASFKFNFETSGLEIKSIIEDGLISGISASRNNTSLLWVVEDPSGNNDIKQDGVLFTLEVLVTAGTAPGVYPIELTLGKEAIVDSNYNVQVPTAINNGQVEVIDVVTSGVTGEVTTVETSGVTGEVTTAATSGVTGEVTTAETSGVTGEVTTAATSGVTGEVTTVETSGVTGEVTTEETSGVTGEVTTVELTTAATTAITTDTTTDTTTVTTTEPTSKEFSIDIAKVTVNYSTVDQVVKVPVSIKNNPGFASFKFNFETSGLEIKSIIEDGLISGISASRNNTSLLWVVEDPSGNNDIKQDGVLFTLEVLVTAGTAPGVYPIELTLGKEAIVDSNYNVQVPTAINNGQVEVIDVVTSGVTGEVTTVETSGVTGEVTTAATSGVTGEVTTAETSGVTGEVTTAATSGVTSEVTTVTTQPTTTTTSATQPTTVTTTTTSATQPTTVTTTTTSATQPTTITTVTTTASGVTSEITTVTTTGTVVTSDVTTTTTTSEGVDTGNATTLHTGETGTDITTKITVFAFEIEKVKVNESPEAQTVPVKVIIHENPGMVAARFYFNLPEGMKIESVSDGILSGAVNSRENNTVVWMKEDTQTISQNGTMFTLMISVPAGMAPGTYPITFGNFGKEDVVGTDYTILTPKQLVDGEIEIISLTPTVTTVSDTTASETTITTVSDTTASETTITTISDTTASETTITTVSDTTASETTITTVSDTTPSETTVTTVSDTTQSETTTTVLETTPSETTITTVSDTTASETTITTVSDTTASETTVTTVSDTTPSETTVTTVSETTPTSISERATIKVNKPIKFNFAHDEQFDLAGLDVTAIITRVAIFEDGTTKDLETTTENISAVCAPLGTPKNTYDKTSFVYDVPLEYKGANQLIADEFKKNVPTFKALVGQKGDANLDHNVDTRDVSLVLREYSANIFGNSILESQVSTNESIVKELNSVGIATLADFSKFLGNVDENSTLNTVDATFIARYYASNIFTKTEWNDILG